MRYPYYFLICLNSICQKREKLRYKTRTLLQSHSPQPEHNTYHCAREEGEKGVENYFTNVTIVIFLHLIDQLGTIILLKLATWSRYVAQDEEKICLRSELFFVTVRRIYFTLPKEHGYYASHCLGKKPGCKLGETHLERSSTLCNSTKRTRSNLLLSRLATAPSCTLPDSFFVINNCVTCFHFVD